MIKHVVMWKISEENINMAVKKLRAMDGKIDVMKNLQVGKNFNTQSRAFDLILINEFDSREALDLYQNHPVHLKVKEYLGTVTTQAAVVDFEF